jgi:hypothetical protein
MNRKIKTAFMATALAITAGGFLSLNNKAQTGNFYCALGYVAAKKGASAEAGLIIGLGGVADAAIRGAAYGMVFGPAAGITAGVISGL